MRRLLDDDGVIRTEFIPEADGRFTLRQVQDVTPVLEHNKALATHNDGYSPSRELRRAASIPLVVVEQWRREGIDIFDPNSRDAVRSKLNSSEWAYLRTAPGRL